VKTRLAAAARNFLRRRTDGTLLPAEVVVPDGLCEDLLNSRVEAALSTAAVRFLREQRREQARRAIQSRPAVQRRRGAVASASAFKHYRTGAARSIEQWSDETSPAPCFLPIPSAEVVQVGRRTVSGFCGRRPEIGDSQTLDFTGSSTRTASKPRAWRTTKERSPHRTAAPSVSDKLVVKRLTSASKCALARPLVALIFPSTADFHLGSRHKFALDANTIATKCRRCRLPVQGAGVRTAAPGQIVTTNRKRPWLVSAVPSSLSSVQSTLRHFHRLLNPTSDMRRRPMVPPRISLHRNR
jgi:hypothetical protein